VVGENGGKGEGRRSGGEGDRGFKLKGDEESFISFMKNKTKKNNKNKTKNKTNKQNNADGWVSGWRRGAHTPSRSCRIAYDDVFVQ
jgi:hypothetical protein